ncbi:hypothetical protein LCGC14_1210040 [marine sediment metagenome]|uniref:Uncharacterized protein n=1 Tax=marine sediment metagenome TaxID=412755 RepID=A0A0F9PJ12_9ZZZZ
MWFPFFLVGGFWFFALVGLVCLALLVAVETESPFWAASALIGFGLALHFLGDLNVFSWLIKNPLRTALCVGGYFVTGALWSVGKWWFFVRNKRDKYNERRRDFISANDLEFSAAIPPEHQKDFKRHMKFDSYGGMPDARAHKSRILTWMTYWPWSMVWTLINDPIKKLFRMIYRRLQRVYDKISESVWSGVEEDFAPVEDKASQ